MNNYFSELSKINVNDKTEKKNGLTYLSWAWAWGEFKKVCPDATYEVVKFDNGKPYFYDPITGYMCYTKVTAGGLTHEMWLPVMDGANKTMLSEPYTYRVKNPNFKYAKLDAGTGKYFDRYGNEQTEYIEKTCEAATMFDINKTIMRCLTKNLAMFGLSLYIYAGEDLPEDEKGNEAIYACEACGSVITSVKKKDGETWNAEDIVKYSRARFDKCLCPDCQKAAFKEEKMRESNAKPS